MIQPTKDDANAKPDLREVSYEYSNNLIGILNRLNISLFFTTYQAGKLGVITVVNNSLKIRPLARIRRSLNQVHNCTSQK